MLGPELAGAIDIDQMHFRPTLIVRRFDRRSIDSRGTQLEDRGSQTGNREMCRVRASA